MRKHNLRFGPFFVTYKTAPVETDDGRLNCLWIWTVYRDYGCTDELWSGQDIAEGTDIKTLEYLIRDDLYSWEVKYD